MKREIVTYPIDREQMEDELVFFAEYFSNQGYEDCEVLFGFAWGNHYYPGNEWWYEKIPLKYLLQKLRQVEESGIGSMGRDDIVVKIADLEFEFGHDSDINISFYKPCQDAESFYSRWKTMGFKPAEWMTDEASGERTIVRSD